MKTSIIMLVILLTSSLTSADTNIVGRISVNLTNGEILEYQSGYAPLGTLTQNAINSGHNPINIDEKYITQYDFSIWQEYGVYPRPNQIVIDALKQSRLDKDLLEAQNQTEKALSKQDLQTKYQNLIDNLNTVVNNSNYIQAKTNWTNADIVPYMKVLAWNDEVQAKGQIAILKILRWML